MAQVCGGTTYDFEWDRVKDAALNALRRAADGWAYRGPEAYWLENVAALIIHHLAAYRRQDVYGSFRQQLDNMVALEHELQGFRRKLALDDLICVRDRVRKTLENAVAQWAEGDPESPATERVLNDIIGVLFEYRLIPRLPTWRISS